MATSSSELLEMNTKSVNTNPFGVYICQLNASGEMFQKFIELKEQGKDLLNACDHHIGHVLNKFLVSLRLTMSGENCIVS